MQQTETPDRAVSLDEAVSIAIRLQQNEHGRRQRTCIVASSRSIPPMRLRFIFRACSRTRKGAVMMPSR
jgi:hypothetical protein